MSISSTTKKPVILVANKSDTEKLSQQAGEFHKFGYGEPLCVSAEQKLGKEAIKKVILVGGPTLAPYFRELLAAKLGIPLDHSVDPLTVVASGAAVFASDREALRQTRKEQEHWCHRADRRVGGHDRNQQRARAHHEYRDHHRCTAAVRVRDPTKQPASERPHEEAHSKNAGGTQKLTG